MCALGIILFGISLAIPALRHGKDTLGVECFTMGLFCIFGSSESDAGRQRQLMSLVSHAMHVSLLVPAYIVWGRKHVGMSWRITPLLFSISCIAILLTVPYAGIEQVYAGYYIWLSSIVIIAISPFVSCSLATAG